MSTISPVRKEDRRLYPRKECRVSLQSGSDYIANISMGGVKVHSSHRYNLNDNVELKFSLPQYGSLKVTGRVVNEVALDDADLNAYYGLAFENITRKDLRKIKQYVLNRLKRDELAELNGE